MGSYSVFGPVDPNIAATLAAQGNPSYTGVALHTSTQSIPIPIMLGTRRVAPNLIWASAVAAPFAAFASLSFGVFNWSDAGGPSGAYPVGGWFKGKNVVSHSGGGSSPYGDNDPSSTFCHYWVPAIQALCEGPIDATAPNNTTNGINRVWGPNGQPALPWNFPGGSPPEPSFIGSEQASPWSLAYEVIPGSSTQTAWAFFSANTTTGVPIASLYPNQAMAYRGTALLATPLLDMGSNRSPSQQAFEVCRTFAGYSLGDSYGIGIDVSPAIIIADIFTNPQYGLGFQTSDFDATSLANYRNYCGAQGFFFSVLLDAQVAGTDLVDRIAQESNSFIFWGGTSFMFVPLGDEAITLNGYTFTPDTTPAYDISVADFLEPLQVDRADPADCFNHSRLEYPHRAADYATTPLEYKDTTLINQFGMRDASVFSADDICDSAVAAIALDLMAKRMAHIRNTYSFTVSYKFIRLLPGSIITLTDPTLGLVAVPVRITGYEEDGGGNLKFTAEEYSGVLGIARPTPVQPWLQSGAGPAGTTGAIGTGGGTGTPIVTSGGGTTLTSGSPSVIVLFVAGDTLVLPAAPIAGVEIVFCNDLQRVPQPTDPDLDSNPAFVEVPGGASYTVEDPQDRSLAAAARVALKTAGGTYRFVFDGGSPGIMRSV